MEIKNKNNRTVVAFEDIKNGEVFGYNGSLFMKTDYFRNDETDDLFAAIRLQFGESAYFTNGTPVEKVKGYFLVEN